MLGLLVRLLLDVRVASHLGAALAGHPEFGGEIVAIARRESRLQLVSVHARDAAWSRAVRPEGCTGSGYATRGVHGQFAARALEHLPSWCRCWPVLVDVPLVSAYTATKRAKSKRCSQVLRCRSWRSA